MTTKMTRREPQRENDKVTATATHYETVTRQRQQDNNNGTMRKQQSDNANMRHTIPTNRTSRTKHVYL